MLKCKNSMSSREADECRIVTYSNNVTIGLKKRHVLGVYTKLSEDTALLSPGAQSNFLKSTSFNRKLVLQCQVIGHCEDTIIPCAPFYLIDTEGQSYSQEENREH